MRSESAPLSPAAYAACARQALAHVERHALARLESSAGAWSCLEPQYEQLLHASHTLESALDLVDFQLLEGRSVLTRMLRRADAPLRVLGGQIDAVVRQWPQVRECAQAVAVAHAQAGLCDARAALEVQRAARDCESRLARAAKCLSLAGHGHPAAPLAAATPFAQVVQAACDRTQVLRDTVLDARGLVQQLHALAASRGQLDRLFDTELVRAISVWSIHVTDLLDSAQRGSSVAAAAQELVPRHNALRRLAHKCWATCSQLQAQERAFLEAAQRIATVARSREARGH